MIGFWGKRTIRETLGVPNLSVVGFLALLGSGAWAETPGSQNGLLTATTLADWELISATPTAVDGVCIPGADGVLAIVGHGEWNTGDILCQGNTLEVRINGVRQNRVSQCSPASGKIGFQLEGAPFELRHVELQSATESPTLTAPLPVRG